MNFGLCGNHEFTVLLYDTFFCLFCCKEALKKPENADQKKEETTVEQKESEPKFVEVAKEAEKRTEEVCQKEEATATDKEASGAVDGSASEKLEESSATTAEGEKPAVGE